MSDKILNMELSPEDEKLLRESLLTWKEGMYADLLEEVELAKTEKIEELEEANRSYQELMKEEYAEKLITALDEMRSEIKSEVIAEMVTSNPELKVLEEIKRLIAPTLNEEYLGNMFAEEMKTLQEENEYYKYQLELDEGAQTLADLLSPYSSKTQNIILAMIKEGNSEEVTEQFYELIESLELINEEEEPEGDDDDGETGEDFESELKDLLKAAGTTKKDFEDDIEDASEAEIKKAVKDLIKDAKGEDYECSDEEGLIDYVVSKFSSENEDDDDYDDDDYDDEDDVDEGYIYDDDDDDYDLNENDMSFYKNDMKRLING